MSSAIQENTTTPPTIKGATATKVDPTVRKDVKQPKSLPAPNSDFYELAETLPAEELGVVKQVRAFMETKVTPIITKYWVDDAFPFELLPALKELNIGATAVGTGLNAGDAATWGIPAISLNGDGFSGIGDNTDGPYVIQDNASK